MTEMAEMNYLPELQRQHQLFAEEAFTFLLEHSENKYFNEYRIFQPYIGDAIVTISYIFRNDYRRIFSRLRKNLKHIKMFEKYCMIVPVKKDVRYFYYILKRVSVIFELTLYCYNEGYDYFKIGKKYVAEYEDLQYFESVGGWGKLAHTALLIASLGRPLTLVMYHDYNECGEIIQTFDEAFSTLYKNFLITANLEMIDSAEKFCLMELNKMFRTQVPEGEVKCGKKKTKKDKEFFEDLEIYPKTTFDYPKGASCILIAEYFRKCLLDLISSKALGYLINNFDYENMLDAFDLRTIINVEEFEALRDPQNSAHHLNVDFTGMKVNYIELYKSSSPVISAEKIEEFLVEEQLRADLDISEESSVLDTSQLDSNLHSPEKILVKIPLTLKKSPGEYLKVMPTDTPEDLDQNSNYDNLEKNLASGEELIITPTFIVPKKYLRLTNTDDASKNMHLYTVKMCPPSTRKKLCEPLKKLLDKNIDNENYNLLPSGDILVCRCESSMNNTLIVLAESSSEDEVDDDTDILICLFKKMELDSLGNEKGYSLRSRQLSLLKKDKPGSSLDRVKTTKEMTSDEETPLKKSRTVKYKQGTSVGDEKRYAKKLINLYKKYFISFLDKYFNTEFYSLKMRQCVTDSEINEDINDSEINDCKYVFAVTASLMAQRKVLLDDPDENKLLFGIQLYHTIFLPTVLPLEVQRELDLQIRKRNYFVASNGVYGVGPQRKVPRENIWAIFISGSGKDRLEIKNDDVKEIPNVFRSYEPILKTFLPVDNVDLTLGCLHFLLSDFVNTGLNAQ